MEVLIVACLLGLITGAIANKKGHSFVKWWVYGALLFIVALPFALLLKPNKGVLEQQQLAEGMIKCPSCAEMIKAEARICRYCREEVAVAQALPRS